MENLLLAAKTHLAPNWQWSSVTFWSDWRKMELFLSRKGPEPWINFILQLNLSTAAVIFMQQILKFCELLQLSTTGKALCMHGVPQGCASCHCWTQHLFTGVLCLKPHTVHWKRDFWKFIIYTCYHPKCTLGCVKSFECVAVELTAVF